MRLLIRVNPVPNKTHLNTQTAMYTQTYNIPCAHTDTVFPRSDATVTILLLVVYVRLLFEGSYYSRTAFIIARRH